MKSLDPCWPFSERLGSTGWALPITPGSLPLAPGNQARVLFRPLSFQTLSSVPLACLVLQSTLADG